MKTYRLFKNEFNNISSVAIDNMSIPICADNTDYQTFKREVLAGAELQDDTGNVMTQEQANQFVASLP